MKLNRIRRRHRQRLLFFHLRVKLLPWLTFILIIASLSYLLVFSPLFRFTKLHCSFDQGPCPAEILAELHRLRGQNSLFTSTHYLETKLSKLPTIQRIYLITQLPNQLFLEINTRQPQAALAVASQSAAFIVDSQNQVINFVTSPLPDLSPIISSQAAQLKLGQIIVEPELLFGLNLFHQLKRRLINFSWIKLISTHQAEIFLENQTIAIISSTNINQQLTSLQLILGKVTIKPKLIDLRFKNPILQY